MSEIYLLKQKKALSWFIYFLSAFWGFHSALTTLRKMVDRSDWLLSVLIAVVVTLYCLVEAKVQRKPIPLFAGWVILITWPISVPICLFWLHGKQRFFFTLLSLLSVVAICYVGAIVASIIAAQ